MEEWNINFHIPVTTDLLTYIVKSEITITR